MHGKQSPLAGRGISERPFNQPFWLSEIEKSLSGSAKDTYIASRSRILSMRQYFSERDASARVACRKSKAPTYNVNRVQLTEGTPKVLAVEAIDWRPAGDFPIENPLDVLMLEFEVQFRYNNKRAVGGIRNFTAIPDESTSQRHSRLARLMAENPTILHMEMEVRIFLESYPKHKQKAN